MNNNEKISGQEYNCTTFGRNLNFYQIDKEITSLIEEHAAKCRLCLQSLNDYKNRLALPKYSENPVEDIFFKETLDVSSELIELSRIAQKKLRGGN